MDILGTVFFVALAYYLGHINGKKENFIKNESDEQNKVKKKQRDKVFYKIPQLKKESRSKNEIKKIVDIEKFKRKKRNDV